MSGEIEALGTLATVGLIARAVAGGGEGHAGEELHDCQNCGAMLVGPFCHACGQSGHVHRTLGHLAEEFAHGVFHVESRGWRTLPMLVINPGRLTREYIHGRRARYIAPLAMFLFMVFLTFFTFGITGASVIDTGNIGPDNSMPEAAGDLRNAQRELDDAVKDPDATPAERATVMASVEAARVALAKAGSSVAKAQTMAHDPRNHTILSGSNWADAIRKANARGEIDVHTGYAPFDTRVHHALDDPEFAAYKIQEKASKLSFLLVPMTLPILWLLFARRREVNLYDHVVFALYSLSFMSLLAILLMLFSNAPAWIKPFAGFLLLALPIHMFAQLKGSYGLTTRGALWRTAVLSISCLTILGLFFALMLLVGLID